MIRENSLFCKLIRIKSSSKALFDSFMKGFRPELQTCPCCGARGACRIHACYGGGLGIPPLLELSKRIPGEAEVFLGYADAPFMDGDFRGHGRKVHVASQTGNGGFRGTVLELVETIAPLADRVYACGPRQMLQAVAEWAERQGIPVQVSMEERMACGIGACLGCAVKIQKPGEKDWQYLRVCRDGPVFSGREVVWNG